MTELERDKQRLDEIDKCGVIWKLADRRDVIDIARRALARVSELETEEVDTGATLSADDQRRSDSGTR
jgi:hypothetical protein